MQLHISSDSQAMRRFLRRMKVLEEKEVRMRSKEMESSLEEKEIK